MTTSTYRKIQEFSHYTSGKKFYQFSERVLFTSGVLKSASDLELFHLLKGSSVVLERDCDQTIPHEVIVERRSGQFRVVPYTQEVQKSRTELSFYARYEEPYWVFRLHYES